MPAASPPELKIGIVGLDTSHSAAFARILHDTSAPNHVPGAKVVAAVKAFSPDIPLSRDRVEGFTKTIREECGVEIVGTIEDLCAMVDCVMIESVDGRPHLEQARSVLAARK